MGNTFFELVRSSCENPFLLKPKTVIIAGNGIIEKGWEPLITAIREAYPIQVDQTVKEMICRNEDTLGRTLSYTSYLYRTNLDAIVAQHIAVKKTAFQIHHDDKQFLDDFVSFREKIAHTYNNADLKIRKIPEPIRSLIEEPDTCVITTNWDPTLWKAKCLRNLIQLHGLSEYPKSLILPTEFISQDAVFDNLHKRSLLDYEQAPDYPTRKEMETLRKNYYRGNLFGSLTLAHRLAIEWVRGAELVVFWGIHCHVYDAELNVVIGMAVEGDVEKKFLVVNLNSQKDSTLNIFQSIVRCDKIEFLGADD